MIKINYSKYLKVILIAVAGILMFVPLLGRVHLFDWDEINFAEAAREMIVSGNYLQIQINFQPFYEKPPLFIWRQVLSMKLFGINEFAARFPNAIIGIISLLTLFQIGKKIHSEKFGLIWVISYLVSLLPHFYFKSGLIDPSFNLFIFLSIYFLYIGLKENNFNRYIVYAGLFNSLAILTKGPVGFLLAILTISIFLLLSKNINIKVINKVLVFSIISFIPYLIWFIEVIKLEPELFNQFITYQIRLFTTSDAGHGGPFYYHFVVLLIGCFPASIFFFIGYDEYLEETSKYFSFKKLMLSLFWVVLILFSIVSTKIVHYSSLAYFPITFIAALGLLKILENKKHVSKLIISYIIFKGLAIGILITGFIYSLMNITKFLNFITDKFTYSILTKPVVWNGLEIYIGVLFLFFIILGFSFLILKKHKLGLITICIAQLSFLNLFLPVVAPKIEEYTQSDLIQFCSSLKGKDVYIMTLGYKSYISYFYTEIHPSQSLFKKGIKKELQEEYLLKGKIDKDAYFTCKITQANEFLKKSDSNLKEIYRTSGYVFLKREKSKS